MVKPRRNRAAMKPSVRYKRQSKNRPQNAARAVFCGGVKVVHRRILDSRRFMVVYVERSWWMVAVNERWREFRISRESVRIFGTFEN